MQPTERKTEPTPTKPLKQQPPQKYTPMPRFDQNDEEPWIVRGID